MNQKVKEKTYQLIEYLRLHQFLPLDVTDNVRSSLADTYLNHPEVAGELEAYAEANHFRFVSRKQVLVFIPLLKPKNSLALTEGRTLDSLKHTNAFTSSMSKLQIKRREELARYCALTLFKLMLDDRHVSSTGNFQDHPVTYQEWAKEIDTSLTRAVDKETEASEFSFQDLLDTWQQLQPETKDNHPKDVNSQRYFLIKVVLRKLFIDHHLVNYMKQDELIQPLPILVAYAEYLNSDDNQVVVNEFLNGKAKEEDVDAKTE